MLPTISTSDSWRIISFPNIKMRIITSTRNITYPASTGTKAFDFTYPTDTFDSVYSHNVSASITGRIDTEVKYVRGSKNGCQAYLSCGATANTSGLVYIIAVGSYT